ncbi:MAG: hypothetical protein EOP09_08610 [Proteobacteria bacterium]|nr:MAG: hypothetical protein EOP09_08610 [Pseudomonadota bacterium]
MKTFSHLKPHEFATLPRDRTWVLIPVGGIEDHGSHLPLGSDLMESRSLAARLGERIEAEFAGHHSLLFPSAALNIDRQTTAASIRFRPHVLRDYLIDCVDSFHRQGFQYFAVVSGNYGPKQLTVIEEASQILAKRSKRFLFFTGKKSPKVLSLCSSDIELEKKSRSLIWADFPEHGGKRDTSLGLLFFPEHVESLSGLPGVELEKTGWSKKRALEQGELSGYWGTPSEASSELGTRLADQKIAQWLPLIAASEKGVSSLNLINSRYAKIPLNYSLFMVWLMAFFILFFFMGWIYFSMLTLFQGAQLQ